MNYVNRLPMFLALFASIIGGVSGYSQNLINREIYIRMILAMIIFYIIGMILRDTIMGTVKQIEDIKKKKKEESARLEEEERIAQKENEEQRGSNIDYTIGDNNEDNQMEDDFDDDIPIAEIIRQQLNK